MAETSIDSDLPVGDEPDQHTMHDEVVADAVAGNAGDNAVDTAVDDMVTNASSSADPIAPLLSFRKQSTDSAATAIAGKQRPLRHLSPL